MYEGGIIFVQGVKAIVLGVKVKKCKKVEKMPSSTRWVSKMPKPMGIPKLPKNIYGLKNAKMFEEVICTIFS